MEQEDEEEEDEEKDAWSTMTDAQHDYVADYSKELCSLEQNHADHVSFGRCSFDELHWTIEQWNGF